MPGPTPKAGPTAPPDVVHLLSFDVEEYFQVQAAAKRLPPQRWGDWPLRLAAPVDRILDLLAEGSVTATFFVLGWVARHERAVVRRIADAGHEIACHGMTHRMIGGLSRDEFAAEVREARGLLEDIAGRAVIGHRAPTFSITRETAWALDALAEAGFAYDASVFPIRHDRYGVPGAPPGPHRAVGPGGGDILEIPPLTVRLLGADRPAGGGGYLRLLPVGLIGRALRSAQRQGRPGMIYLHPWELDPDQPVLPMSPTARWRHRVGLKKTESKLRYLLDRFRFTAVAGRLDELRALAGQTYTYG